MYICHYSNSFKEINSQMNMKKQVIFTICLVLLIGSVLAVDVTKVGDWWGTVKVNGEYTNGAVVDAYINNVRVASAIVGDIQPNYYLIHVEGDVRDNIVFKVNEKEAETESWSYGDHKLNLEVIIDSDEENNNGGSPSGGSPSGNSPIIITSQTTDNQTTNEENETIDLNSNEKQEPTSPGITGGVIGFIKSGGGLIALGFFILVVAIGIGVMVIKFKPLKKWIEKSSG